MEGNLTGVHGTATNECPVSLLTVDRISTLSYDETIQSFARAKVMNKALGVSPYGGDLNKWPSKMVDAFVLLEDESSKVDKIQSFSTKGK